MQLKHLITIWLLFAGSYAMAQEIVVNEYYDETSQNNEWTELVVVKDDLDLRGWYIGDNNASTSSWQPKLRFHPTNTFWQHMRTGTIILLDHAQGTDESNCNDVYDYDKSDGFVRICVRNQDYFEGGSSTTNFISASGDFIHLINPSGKMVHGIGHDDNPGGSVIGTPCFSTSANWTDINVAKANTPPCENGPFTFWKINLNVPMSLRMMAGSLPEFSSHLLEANASNNAIDTSDTPFTGIGNGPANDVWLNELRAPVFQAQAICSSIDFSGNISFTWNTMLDPVPADGTCGYMVVRNQTNDFGLPEQGKEYALNSIYGTGNQEVKVVALIDHTSAPTITYTENPGPGTFYYRVFPYRYKNTPNIFHPTRGRAYNSTQYVKVRDLMPPMAFVGITICKLGETVTFSGSTNDLFNFELYDAPVGGNLVAIGPNIQLVVMDTASLWLDFLNATWCDTERVEIKVKLKMLKPCEFEAPDSICPGSTAKITGKGGPGVSYFWETVSAPAGTGSEVISDSIFNLSTIPGIEPQMLIFRGKCKKDGCESDFRRDTIFAVPIDCRYSSPDSVCEGVPAKITGTAGPEIKYRWEATSIPTGMTVGNPDSSVFEVSANSSSLRRWLVYQVQCRNQSNCLSRIYKDSIYTVPMEYNLYFDPGIPTSGKPVYVGLESEWKSWKVSDWKINAGEIQSKNPVFMVFVPGAEIPEVSADVEFLDAAGSVFCKSSKTIRRSIPNLVLETGQAAANRILSFDGVPLAYLRIYNRWGKKVAEFGGDYSGNWPDGKSEPGVYFYEAGLSAGKESLRGWVELRK